MRPDPESANAEHHEDDAWFAAESAASGATRERQARWALGALIVLLLLAGWGLGAFSEDGDAQAGPDVARLRARAQAAATSSPLSAGDNAALLAGLDRLLATLPAPASAGPDAGAADEIVEPPPGDGAGVAGERDGGPGANAEAPGVIDLDKASLAVVEARTDRPSPVETEAVIAELEDPQEASPSEPKKAEPKVAEPAKAETKKAEVAETKRVEPAEANKIEPADTKKAAPEPAAEPKKTEGKSEATPVEPAAKPSDAESKPLDAKSKASVDEALTEAKKHLDAGRWSEARAAYDRVLKAAPGNPRALLGRGRALLELRQVQPALKDLKAVLEIEPKNPTALLFAGTISQELGQREQARGYYQRYLDAWPSGRKAGEVKALLERL